MKFLFCNFLRSKIFLFIFSLSCTTIILFSFLNFESDLPKLSPYPNGKNFAFTVTDDPDGNTLNSIKPIYDFLLKSGFKTTAAVWVDSATYSTGIPNFLSEAFQGDSCANPDYLEYMIHLNNNNFEIALHTATAGNDYRNVTKNCYEKFKQYFGYYPKINIMHSTNLDNVYWGSKVVNNNLIQKTINRLVERARFPYGGENPESIFFWGDILKEKTKYVRLWGTSDINTLKYNPSMPYHDPKKPFVNYWFSFSDGYNVDIFNNLISAKNIDKLNRERGACIVYTHFSSNFSKKATNGVFQLNKIFKARMETLSKNHNGWFVPASTILDRLLLLKNINIFNIENGFIVTNSNEDDISGVTVITEPGLRFFGMNGDTLISNAEGEIIISKISANGSVAFFSNIQKKQIKNCAPDYFEKINLLFRRSLVFLRHRVF